jgi:IS30 family transposase
MRDIAKALERAVSKVSREVARHGRKLPEVRDFFHQVAAAEKSSAVLRRANP